MPVFLWVLQGNNHCLWKFSVFSNLWTKQQTKLQHLEFAMFSSEVLQRTWILKTNFCIENSLGFATQKFCSHSSWLSNGV